MRILAVLALLVAQAAARELPVSVSRSSLSQPARQLGTHGRMDSCESYLGTHLKSSFSVVLNADPGLETIFAGTPEAKYILANLQHKLEKPQNQTVCALFYFGTLLGQPVLAATTGIGPTAAALCVQEIVGACGHKIKDIVFSGTSGWSPQLGGTLNPDDCSTPNTKGRINRFGDVWVGPFSVDWSCKLASWSEQARGYPNQCSRPVEEAGPEVSSLFGQCIFYQDNVAANLRLSEEVLAAARRNVHAFPKRSANVTAIEQRYWATFSQFANVNYGQISGDALPTCWDYNTAVEVDSQFFFSGHPWDLTARDYVAETLSLIKNKTVKATQVINVNAMEGVGVSEAMQKYHRLATTQRKIPYTYVRTMSDWLYQSVKQTAPGVWQDSGTSVVDFPTGFAYAVATGSATVLSLYQARCQRDVAAGRLSHDFCCTYTLDYNQ